MVFVKNAGVKLNKYTLFTPGPTDIPPDVLKVLSKPIFYHREENFAKLLKEVTDALGKILSSSGKIYFFTSSGTGAMEAACTNILSSKDKPVVALCGKFGQRWLELCKAYRIKPIVIKEDYGKAISPDKIEKVLKKRKSPTVLFTTLTETSTGVLNDIKAFGKITKKFNAYLVVDGVAGIGADRCYQDEWNIDILVGASQKALMSPPGISFISVSKRALKKIQTSTLPKYYFDLNIYEKFREKAQTPWTPAINVLVGLARGLKIILKRGIEKNFLYHQRLGDHTRQRVQKMGLEIMPSRPSNALTVVKMPEDIGATRIIKRVKEKYGILFADGQAELKNRIIRIGHMGNYSIRKMDRALDALAEVLNQWRR